MEIDQDLKMNNYNIYVGTEPGQTAIFKQGIQTRTVDGDTSEFFNGDLFAYSITAANGTLKVYGNINQYNSCNIRTSGKITASTIDATIDWSKINIDTNLDLGDKNLTTTGTITASNIPSST